MHVQVVCLLPLIERSRRRRGRSIKARQIQAVRERDKLSYAMAVQTVTKEHREERGGSVILGNVRAEPNRFPPDMLVMSKELFLSFVVEVLAAAK